MVNGKASCQDNCSYPQTRRHHGLNGNGTTTFENEIGIDDGPEQAFKRLASGINQMVTLSGVERIK
jgi:hypothetical protein